MTESLNILTALTTAGLTLFAWIAGRIAYDLLRATGDPEHGKSGFPARLYSVISGVAIAAGLTMAFSTLGWLAFVPVLGGALLGMLTLRMAESRLPILRRISESACIILTFCIYALS